jgi:alpha-tubulin suppressor-like RCC1 family protein
VRAAAAGAAHSMVLTANGASVWAWGDNRHGQCGLGSRGAATGQPWPNRVDVNPTASVRAASVITAISAGGHHSLVVNADGALFAAGRGRHGALGLGNSYSRRVLVPVVRVPQFHVPCTPPFALVSSRAVL